MSHVNLDEDKPLYDDDESAISLNHEDHNLKPPDKSNLKQRRKKGPKLHPFANGFPDEVYNPESYQAHKKEQYFII